MSADENEEPAIIDDREQERVFEHFKKVARRGRRYRRYPEYKDSGVEWLGEIPAGWEVSRLKRLLRRCDYGVSETLTEGGEIRVLTMAHIQDGKVQLPEAGSINTIDSRLLLDTNDLLFNRTNSRDLVGKVGLFRNDRSDQISFASYLVRMTPRGGLDPEWLNYLLNSAGVLCLARSMALLSVSQANLNPTKYTQIDLPLPTNEEQRAIADLLDLETSRIDALIAKKERLIELLQEKRTALITRAVTKGLDSNVPMKDSGVGWLGEIPAHWEAAPLKAVSSLQTGLTLGKVFEDRGSLVRRPYLRVANVQDGFLALADIAEVEVPAADTHRYELRRGDVLLTEGGDFDKLGRGYVWDGEVAGCLHQNHIFAVRPWCARLKPYFLAHVLRSAYGRAYFTATSKQSTNLASTNSTKLRNLPIPLPGLDEQDAIISSVAQQTGRVESLIAMVHDAISRLRELRTALISAAVTGKIDVREKAA